MNGEFRAGHTPQRVAETIGRRRREALLGATVPGVLARGHSLTSSSLSQPQHFRRPSILATLAAIDAFAFRGRLVGVREPWPLEFRVVFPPEIPS